MRSSTVRRMNSFRVIRAILAALLKSSACFLVRNRRLNCGLVLGTVGIMVAPLVYVKTILYALLATPSSTCG